MGADGLSFGRYRDDRTPPAGANAHIANCEKPGRNNQSDQNESADPTKAQFQGFAALDAFLAYVRSERGPAIVRGIDGQTHLARRFDEAVSPVAGVESESADVPANDAFAQDSTGELLEPILFQGDEVALADLGDSSDLLKRYTARQPLRSKLFPKSTHLVTSPDIIA